MSAPPRLTAALSDRYRLERELGAGGMATVYLALDLKHRRKVAIKVLRPELSAVLGSERFLKEIELTASLQHPNILPLFDSGSVHPGHPERSEGSAGLLFYVMPFVEGETLRSRLAREHQLPIPEAVRIASAVGAALVYAHRHGAVHRDIKPENILLSEDSVLVADFGIALAVRDAGGARLTETGLSLGTPQYMSPEQATGDRHVDARSDIYSLGSVLYEMLAGEPPFSGPTTQAVIAKLVTERPVRLRTLRDTVPPTLEATVERAIAKAPADRFASCREFIEALAAAPPATSPPLLSTALAARSRRRWAVPLLVAIGVATLLAAGWATTRHSAPKATTPLEKVQLTFTGNAAVPALSHDGTKVAYTTRQCDTVGRCTYDVVVQDMGGAGTATVLRGALTLWPMSWTEDGRYLVFDGSFGPQRWGSFSVPSLGGDLRFLGCCTGRTGLGDTVLVADMPRTGDSVAWVRWMRASDGITRDSLQLLARDPVYVEELSRGRLLVSHVRVQGVTQVVMTRAGRVIDSVSFYRPNAPSFYFITSERDRIANWFPRANRAREYDLVLYRVGTDGRLGTPDTVYSQLTFDAAVDYRAGIHVYDDGPLAYSAWALVRPGAASMGWTQRRLAIATGPMLARISSAGARVALGRGVAGAPGMVQLSVMPFDSGPESRVGSPMDLVDWDWTSDEKSIVTAVRRGGDSVAILQLDLATERSQALATVGYGDFQGVASVPGGGIVLLLRDAFRRVGVPVLPDTTFPLASMWGAFAAVSPDGREFARLGWDPGRDTVVAHRISLVDGSAIRLAGIAAEGMRPPRWLQDGTIIVPVFETSGTVVWYGVPAFGGAPVRLGTPPRYPAEYEISADGRRVLARVEDRHTDIYMIRNFSSVLKAK